jgi:hypothetical protein
MRARGSVVGSGTMLQAMGSIPDEVTGFFNLPNFSNRIMIMALGSTRPLTGMSTRNSIMRGRFAKLTTSPPFVSRLPENVGTSTYHL